MKEKTKKPITESYSDNEDFIVFLIKKGELKETLNIKEEFETKGYYIGILQNTLILLINGILCSIWLRPYHCKFLLETLKPIRYQSMSVFSRGVQRKFHRDDALGCRRNYYHVDFNLNLAFLK